jgi:hypothetical protein
MEHRHEICYLAGMTIEFAHPAAQSTPPAETADQRESRIQRELALIEKGQAEIDAGRGIDLEDLEAWFDQLDVDENAPMPAPRSLAPRP